MKNKLYFLILIGLMSKTCGPGADVAEPLDGDAGLIGAPAHRPKCLIEDDDHSSARRLDSSG